MTHYILTISNYLQSPVSEFLTHISKAFYKVTTVTKEVAAARETFKQLNALSDKDLLDMGISRGDIYDIAYNGVNRR